MVQKEECEYRLAVLQLFCEGVKVAYASEVCSVFILLINTHHSTRTRERRPTIGVLLSPQFTYPAISIHALLFNILVLLSTIHHLQ